MACYPAILSSVFAGIYRQPGKSDFARPYDSSFGIPEPYFWVAVIILGYLALHFYLSLRKDKQNKPETSVEKIKKKKNWRPPMKGASGN